MRSRGPICLPLQNDAVQRRRIGPQVVGQDDSSRTSHLHPGIAPPDVDGRGDDHSVSDNAQTRVEEGHALRHVDHRRVERGGHVRDSEESW